MRVKCPAHPLLLDLNIQMVRNKIYGARHYAVPSSTESDQLQSAILGAKFNLVC